MKSLREHIVAIKRRETPFYDLLYRTAKSVRHFSVPTIPPLHSALYHEWTTRTNLWHNFWRVVYYEPMFKSQCQMVGKGFRMEYAGNGSTRLYGDLQIYLGENVTIFDNTDFVGLNVYDKPELHVGDNTYIGPSVHIFVGKKIIIGSHCLIGSRIIADNPGHSFYNVMARMSRNGGPPDIDSIKPITIGDFCLMGFQTTVYPGVTVGDGVVAVTGTHVSRDVPPFCLVSGNPMKIRMKLKIPREIIDIVGEQRYYEYKEIHSKIKLSK